MNTPVVTYSLIALCAVVFFSASIAGKNHALQLSLGAVPQEIATGRDLIVDAPAREVDRADSQQAKRYGVTPVPVYLTLFTSMFIHGNILHLIANALFLLVLGPDIERRVGRLRFLGLYLLGGLFSMLAHVGFCLLLGSEQLTPVVGASGAVSAVLGAYIALYATRKVDVELLWRCVSMPVWVGLGCWFVFSTLAMVDNDLWAAHTAHVAGVAVGFIWCKAQRGNVAIGPCAQAE